MFERKRSGGIFGWTGIVLISAVGLAAIWVVRQNPPSTPAGAAENKVTWTSGKIVEGPIEVEGRGHVSYLMNLNKRSTLRATFTTGDSAKRLTFSVLKAADMERWKAGEEVKLLTNTGQVPRGTVTRVLEPGSYIIVLDNRAGSEPMRLVESDFEVE